MHDFIPAYRSGVGLILVSKKYQAIFVGRRGDDTSNRISWQLPQGGVDQGEDLEVALKREAREEIGTDNFKIVCHHSQWIYYDIPKNIIAKKVESSSWDGRYVGQRIKWFLCEFLGDDSEINISTEHPEFVEWEWSPFPYCFASIVDFKRDMYFKVASIFMRNILLVCKGQPPKESNDLVIYPTAK